MKRKRAARAAVAIAAAGVIAVAVVGLPAPGHGVAAAASTSKTKAASRTRALFAGIGPKTPGCTIAVAREGTVVFAEAYGSANLSTRAKMTTSTIVDIGSTSKQFTATAIAILAERKQLSLDDVVSDYIDDLQDWADDVTIDQLVHHTSGIPDYVDLLSDQGYDDTDRTTDADALDALADVDDLNSKPGRKFEYSNSNYFLLGQIVEQVSGVGVGAFIKREIFTPLKLNAVMDAAAKPTGKARSYAREGKQWVRADSAWLQLGDGGVQTTPTELVKWASQYWSPTIGTFVINTTRWAGAVETGDDGIRYGFGMYEETVDGLGRVLSHDGSWGGFATTFAVLPSHHLAMAATCTSGDLAVENADFGPDVLRYWVNVT